MTTNDKLPYNRDIGPDSPLLSTATPPDIVDSSSTSRLRQRECGGARTRPATLSRAGNREVEDHFAYVAGRATGISPGPLPSFAYKSTANAAGLLSSSALNDCGGISAFRAGGYGAEAPVTPVAAAGRYGVLVPSNKEGATPSISSIRRRTFVGVAPWTNASLAPTFTAAVPAKLVGCSNLPYRSKVAALSPQESTESEAKSVMDTRSDDVSSRGYRASFGLSSWQLSNAASDAPHYGDAPSIALTNVMPPYGGGHNNTNNILSFVGGGSSAVGYKGDWISGSADAHLFPSKVGMPRSTTPGTSGRTLRLADTAPPVHYAENEDLEPFSPPLTVAFLQQIYSRLCSDNWRLQFQAVTEMRRLCRHHSEDLLQPLSATAVSLAYLPDNQQLPGTSTQANRPGGARRFVGPNTRGFLYYAAEPVLELVDSLRSNVAKNAMLLIRDLYTYTASLMSDSVVLEATLALCLRKAGASGAGNFLIVEAEKALLAISLMNKSETKFMIYLLRNLREAKTHSRLKSIVSQCLCVVIFRVRGNLTSLLPAKELNMFIVSCVKLSGEASPDCRRSGRLAVLALKCALADRDPSKWKSFLSDAEIKDFNAAARQAYRGYETESVLGLPLSEVMAEAFPQGCQPPWNTLLGCPSVPMATSSFQMKRGSGGTEEPPQLTEGRSQQLNFVGSSSTPPALRSKIASPLTFAFETSTPVATGAPSSGTSPSAVLPGSSASLSPSVVAGGVAAATPQGTGSAKSPPATSAGPTNRPIPTGSCNYRFRGVQGSPGTGSFAYGSNASETPSSSSGGIASGCKSRTPKNSSGGSRALAAPASRSGYAASGSDTNGEEEEMDADDEEVGRRGPGSSPRATETARRKRCDLDTPRPQTPRPVLPTSRKLSNSTSTTAVTPVSISRLREGIEKSGVVARGLSPATTVATASVVAITPESNTSGSNDGRDENVDTPSDSAAWAPGGVLDTPRVNASVTARRQPPTTTYHRHSPRAKTMVTSSKPLCRRRSSPNPPSSDDAQSRTSRAQVPFGQLLRGSTGQFRTATDGRVGASEAHPCGVTNGNRLAQGRLLHVAQPKTPSDAAAPTGGLESSSCGYYYQASPRGDSDSQRSCGSNSSRRSCCATTRGRCQHILRSSDTTDVLISPPKKPEPCDLHSGAAQVSSPLALARKSVSALQGTRPQPFHGAGGPLRDATGARRAAGSRISNAARAATPLRGDPGSASSESGGHILQNLRPESVPPKNKQHLCGSGASGQLLPARLVFVDRAQGRSAAASVGSSLAAATWVNCPTEDFGDEMSSTHSNMKVLTVTATTKSGAVSPKTSGPAGLSAAPSYSSASSSNNNSSIKRLPRQQ